MFRWENRADRAQEVAAALKKANQPTTWIRGGQVVYSQVSPKKSLVRRFSLGWGAYLCEPVSSPTSTFPRARLLLPSLSDAADRFWSDGVDVVQREVAWWASGELNQFGTGKINEVCLLGNDVRARVVCESYFGCFVCDMSGLTADFVRDSRGGKVGTIWIWLHSDLARLFFPAGCKLMLSILPTLPSWIPWSTLSTEHQEDPLVHTGQKSARIDGCCNKLKNRPKVGSRACETVRLRNGTVPRRPSTSGTTAATRNKWSSFFFGGCTWGATLAGRQLPSKVERLSKSWRDLEFWGWERSLENSWQV